MSRASSSSQSPNTVPSSAGSSKGDLNKSLWRWSWKEIRSGQLWSISLALTLIIASIFALTALAERLEQVIVKQGKDALTADSVYSSANPLPKNLLASVESASVESSTMTRFATMAFSDASMQLVTVKAIDNNYPLRGQLKLQSSKLHSTKQGSSSEIKNRIKPGELWLEDRVFDLLETDVGKTLSIGDADFVVSGRIVEEPGLSFNPFQQMPAVLIHHSDVDKTGAVQLGSRVRFNLFVNGTEEQISSLKESVELTPSDRWRDQSSANRTNEVFDRAQQYLSLTVAIVIIMAATTLVLTCQHYVGTRVRIIAMLKSLGATKAWISRWLAIQVFILFIVAAIVGSVVGIGLESLLRIPLGDLLPSPLPSYGVKPFLLALTASVLIAIPALGIPLLGLLSISAADVMQSANQRSIDKKLFWLVLVPIVPLLIVYMNNTLVWLVLGGMALLFFALAIFSVLIMKLLGKLTLSTSFKLATSRINRSSARTALQFGALSLSLMLLAIMWLVRTDLLADWQRTIPDNAPNAFALNIAPYEIAPYLDVLDEQQLERSEAYPIVRGRVATINNVNASEYAKGEEASDSLRREVNFTWADALPSHNTLIEGEWNAKGGVSVESDVATDLGIEVGDSLTFVINSQTVSATVNSIRDVEWRDMKPNFYFIFTPDLLADIPATWLVSFRLTDANNALMVNLSRQFPTVSLMDIRSMGNKIQELLTQMVWAITVLAVLGVVAGLLLIFTLLRLSLVQRQEEIRLYRTLGASKKRVTRTVWAEFGMMALVAGGIATIGAEAVVATLMIVGFELPATPHYSLWISLPLVAFCTLILVVNSLMKKLLSPVSKDFG